MSQQPYKPDRKTVDPRLVERLDSIFSGINGLVDTVELGALLLELVCQHEWDEKTHINEDSDERDYEVCKKCGAIKEE